LFRLGVSKSAPKPVFAYFCLGTKVGLRSKNKIVPPAGDLRNKQNAATSGPSSPAREFGASELSRLGSLSVGSLSLRLGLVSGPFGPPLALPPVQAPLFGNSALLYKNTKPPTVLFRGWGLTSVQLRCSLVRTFASLRFFGSSVEIHLAAVSSNRLPDLCQAQCSHELVWNRGQLPTSFPQPGAEPLSTLDSPLLSSGFIV